MIDFDRDEPMMYWIYEDPTQRDEEAKTWHEDPLKDAITHGDEIRFDYPPNPLPYRVIRFRQESDGLWHHRSEIERYEAVRAMTDTHVILTGNWRKQGIHRGIFIAVLPRPEDITEAIGED